MRRSKTQATQTTAHIYCGQVCPIQPGCCRGCQFARYPELYDGGCCFYGLRNEDTLTAVLADILRKPDSAVTLEDWRLYCLAVQYASRIHDRQRRH